VAQQIPTFQNIMIFQKIIKKIPMRGHNKSKQLSNNLNLLLNDVINIGGAQEMTILELAKLVIEKINSSSKIVHLPALKEGDMRRRMPDNSKMKAVLGKELIPIEDGIDLMLNDKDFINQCAE
jgi:nucleoside-diphosphate-sugar epimerase